MLAWEIVQRVAAVVEVVTRPVQAPVGVVMALVRARAQDRDYRAKAEAHCCCLVSGAGCY